MLLEPQHPSLPAPQQAGKAGVIDSTLEIYSGIILKLV